MEGQGTVDVIGDVACRPFCPGSWTRPLGTETSSDSEIYAIQNKTFKQCNDYTTL